MHSHMDKVSAAPRLSRLIHFKGGTLQERSCKVNRKREEQYSQKNVVSVQPVLVANSLRPGQEKRTIREPGV